MSTASQSQHILELSRELLDDIELDRLGINKILLKCSRLARLAGSQEDIDWINLEIGGYYPNAPMFGKYMIATGRWTDFKEKKGYFGALSDQEAIITSYSEKLKGLQLPSSIGEHGYNIVRQIIEHQTNMTTVINKVASIRSRVLSLLHQFVTRVYYEREFSTLAETTFERYKSKVDALLSKAASGALDKIPSIIDRIQEGDDEAVSQALSSCRRLIDAFANSVYPATEATVEIDGSTLKIDAAKVQNRINAFINDRCSSGSRRKKLRQNLSNLYDRVSTGVHSDVDVNEAFSIFLNVYLLLGEILDLPEVSNVPAPE